MQCKSCHYDNPDSMKYCGQCGQILTIRCPSCNFESPSNFKFCGNCSASLEEQAAKDEPQKQATISGQEAERRQITVLFCDVVGSTSLSDNIDPEDLRDIMRDYRAACDEVVQQFGGHIAQYLGDGVLVYFGFPQAHEDDAQRAAQTGLALINSLSTLNQNLKRDKGLSIEVRVGIHTGLVVVGGIGGKRTRKTSVRRLAGTERNCRLSDVARHAVRFVTLRYWSRRRRR